MFMLLSVLCVRLGLYTFLGQDQQWGRCWCSPQALKCPHTGLAGLQDQECLHSKATTNWYC